MRSPLPHRSPFIALDTIVEVIPGERAVGEHVVSSADPLLRDGDTVSEALLLEVMAQCAGVAAGAGTGGVEGVLAGVDGFAVRRAVAAGDLLIATARVVKRMGAMVRASAAVHVAGVLCAEARLTLRLSKGPTPGR